MPFKIVQGPVPDWVPDDYKSTYGLRVEYIPPTVEIIEIEGEPFMSFEEFVESKKKKRRRWWQR